MEPSERMAWGRMQNPIRGILCASAALAASGGLVVLVTSTWGRPSVFASALLFGTALVAMFTVSALYHCYPWSEPWRARMQRLDHSLIFVVVAATFTPVAVSSLEGGARLAALVMVWSVGLVGIVLKLTLPVVKTGLSLALQMAMGWSALVWLPEVFRRHGWSVVVPILAGGLCYTAGAVVFATRRPRLFPRVFSHHEAFHVLVVSGAGLHFWAVARSIVG